MGLRETVQGAAQAAIAGTGNIALDGVYINLEKPIDKWTPGAARVQAQEVEYPLEKKLIKIKFKQSQIDGEVVKREDFQLIIANADLEPTPSKNDFIELDCIRYRVVHWTTDPAEAAYTFHMRLV